MGKIFGLAFKPMYQINQKLIRLKEYVTSLFSKDEYISMCFDNGNNNNDDIIDVGELCDLKKTLIDQFSRGDTVVFVGLKDLKYLGPTFLKDLVKKDVTIMIIPYFDFSY